MAEDLPPNYDNNLNTEEDMDIDDNGSHVAPVSQEINRDATDEGVKYPEHKKELFAVPTDKGANDPEHKRDNQQGTEKKKNKNKVVYIKEQLRRSQRENEDLKAKVEELEKSLKEEKMKKISAVEKTSGDVHTNEYVIVTGPNQETENLKQQLKEHLSRIQQKEDEIKNLQTQIQEATEKNKDLEAAVFRLSSQVQGEDLSYQQRPQAEIEELERRNKALQKEVTDWSSRAENLEQSFQQRLQVEMHSLAENIRQLQNERDCSVAKSLQENETWSQKYEQLNNEVCTLRAQENEHKEQIRVQTESNNSYAEALSSMTQQLEQLKLEIKYKDDEIKNFQEAQKISENETQAELRKLHQQITQLKEHNKALNAGKMEAEKQKRLKEDKIRQHDATIRQLQNTMENFKQQYQHNLRECNSKIESLEKEKKDLTLRLSRLAGANLTYNNPNIADLSDENRPTKLAEEFSELYDNEWTDAFEILTAEDEKEKTQVMLNILKEANRLCHYTTKDHTDAVRSGFVTLNVRSDLEVVKMPGRQTPAAALKDTQNSAETTKTSADTQEVQNRDIEAKGEKTQPKTDGEETTENENKPDTPNDADAEEMEVEHTQASRKDLNGIGSAAESADQSHLTDPSNIPLPDTAEPSDDESDEHQDETTDKDQTKLKSGELSTGSADQQTTGNGEPLRPLNDENSTTNFREEQSTQQNENRNFNNQFDKEEVRDEHSGQGTPIACCKSLTANFDDLTNDQKKTLSDIRRFFEDKLSESFRQESTKIITWSLPDNIQNEESLQKYIQKCLQLCWSMCRHEPPVFIHFIEPGSDKPFDTNMYKPYTKTGKYVDYIVWPALYLHEGGPMLAKGVAQGRK